MKFKQQPWKYFQTLELHDDSRDLLEKLLSKLHFRNVVWLRGTCIRDEPTHISEFQVECNLQIINVRFQLLRWTRPVFILDNI